MRISKFLLKIIERLLWVIFKISNMNIRINGKENIPDEPVLYVVNHFTRMETFILPYMLHRITKKFTISVAHHSFFGGGFGRFLSKLGAVSTRDKDIDKIFTNILLEGKYNAVIFPEGQMVKDKKLIENGKYRIYNSGNRRSPHTGAAGMVLKTEFYREKMRYLKEKGNIKELKKLIDHYEIESEEVKTLLKKESYIVPVNITYYPIRAKKNKINKFVERFIQDVPKRLEEELKVEGTMLIDGVDVDISFGKAISAKKYLFQSKETCENIYNTNLYINKEERRKALQLKEISVNLMEEYMNSIYKMTTVNYDHIFAYILSVLPIEIISEEDFKNNVRFIIEKIKGLNIVNFHENINKKNKKKRVNDFNLKYEDFINIAISENLIERKNGFIIKNKEKFIKPYEFHFVRTKNIIKVLKNEIEPITELTKAIKNFIFPYL